MVVRALCARPSLLDKRTKDDRFGVNLYPSHLRQGRGGKIRLSRQIGGGEGPPSWSL